jgi:hypothetical protein
MDDLPPEIAALVEQKRRADEPSADDQARVAKSLAAALGLPNTGWGGPEAAEAAASSAAPTAASGAFMGLKTALVTAVVVITGASAVFVWRGAAPAPDARRPAMPAVDAAGRGASHPPPSAAADAPAQPDTHQAPSATPTPASDSATRRDSPPARGRKQSKDSQPVAAERPQEAALEGELALITAVSRALDRGETEPAMRLLKEHTTRFPAGFLGEERDALWIVALCKQGNVAQAAAARASFERRAPRSPLRVRIEKECK